MRYTTIIDVTDFPMVYRNINARLLYLHLCLRSGYHDDDRDVLEISIRRLADEVGLTLSATRHALKILERCSLISMQHSVIVVTKWVSERSITKRARTKKDDAQRASLEARNLNQARREKELAESRQQREELEAKGLSPFIVFYEKKFEEYRHGDADALASLQRNKDMYLSECKRMKHKPIKIAI